MVNSVVHMPLKPSKIKGLTKERVGDTLAVQCADSLNKRGRF